MQKETKTNIKRVFALGMTTATLLGACMPLAEVYAQKEKEPVKSVAGDYTITFTNQYKGENDARFNLYGGEYKIEQTHRIKTSGEEEELSEEEKAEKIKTVTLDRTTKTVKLDEDGRYKVTQIKRAPGTFKYQGNTKKTTNIDKEDTGTKATGKGEGFIAEIAFPLLGANGEVKKEQNIEIHPKFNLALTPVKMLKKVEEGEKAEGTKFKLHVLDNYTKNEETNLRFQNIDAKLGKNEGETVSFIEEGFNSYADDKGKTFEADSNGIVDFGELPEGKYLILEYATNGKTLINTKPARFEIKAKEGKENVAENKDDLEIIINNEQNKMFKEYTGKEKDVRFEYQNVNPIEYTITYKDGKEEIKGNTQHHTVIGHELTLEINIKAPLDIKDYKNFDILIEDNEAFKINAEKAKKDNQAVIVELKDEEKVPTVITIDGEKLTPGKENVISIPIAATGLGDGKFKVDTSLKGNNKKINTNREDKITENESHISGLIDTYIRQINDDIKTKNQEANKKITEGTSKESIAKIVEDKEGEGEATWGIEATLDSKNKENPEIILSESNYSFKKVAKAEKEEEGKYKVLPGAQFTLYSKNGEKLKRPVPLKEGENEEVKNYFVVKTDEDGIANFENLPEGDFILKETQAPAGYKLSRAEYTFNVKVEDGKTKVEFKNPSKASNIKDLKLTDDGEEEKVFINYANTSWLPETGTRGLLPYAGAGLITLSVAFVVLKKKKEEEEMN